MSAASPRKQAPKRLLLVAPYSGYRQHRRLTWRAPVAKYCKGEIIVGKDLIVV
jgi:hypothetical protein